MIPHTRCEHTNHYTTDVITTTTSHVIKSNGKNPTKRVGLVKVGLHHSKLTCSLNDIAENILSWR
jgi:hypothetical protein